MSVNKVVELLNKQKLVAGMVQGQDACRVTSSSRP